MINIPHNMTLIRRQALRTLQNVTDTTEYEIAIFIGVGWVCGHNFVLVIGIQVIGIQKCDPHPKKIYVKIQ